MGIHYDAKAGEIATRKTLKSFAANITAQENGGVNQKYFNKRFVEDIYHSISFFKKVCKHIGNLENKEIEQMLTKLKNTAAGKEHEFGEAYHFLGDDMYEVLISNPICKKVCEKQKYLNWEDIIIRFS